MNKKNVEKAIAVMERVRDEERAFDMGVWQERNFDPAKTESELCECGTAACFAGWVAVSPEFQAGGGDVSTRFLPGAGSPCFRGEYGSTAIAKWLSISYDEADMLCGSGNEDGVSDIYNCLSDASPDDVLTVLYRLRDTGSIHPQ